MSDEMNVYTPDFLIDALKIENETGSTDLFVNDEQRLPPMRRVEFPQANSRKHGGQAGKIYISGLTAEEEGEYVDSIDFLLVDSLTIDSNSASDWMEKDVEFAKGYPYGGRTMWEFDESGKRVTTADAPVCSSNNGIEPWKQYRDKELYDYRTKQTHRIGWQTDPATGALTRMANACVGCPFSKDVTVQVGVDESGNPVTKWFGAMCRESFTYVIWEVNRQELMTIKAVNLGMQFSLAGRRNKSGRRYDGEEFKGIRYYFSHNGFGSNPTTGAKYPKFVNRPEGKPSPENPNAPVYAVRMTVTLNNFDPSSYVPNMTLLDGNTRTILGVNPKKSMVDGSVLIDAPERKLTAEEYVAYLRDMQRFIQDDYKNRMMAMYLVQRTDQLPALAAPSAAQLGTGNVADTTADYDQPF